jgi:hypothetical protein
MIELAHLFYFESVLELKRLVGEKGELVLWAKGRHLCTSYMLSQKGSCMISAHCHLLYCGLVFTFMDLTKCT